MHLTSQNADDYTPCDPVVNSMHLIKVNRRNRRVLQFPTSLISTDRQHLSKIKTCNASMQRVKVGDACLFNLL